MEKLRKTWLHKAYLIVMCGIMLSAMLAPAQAQRAMTNTSFEENDPRGPGTPSYFIFNDAAVPGWEDETGKIELWDSGFNSTTSYDGNVHAEMNASSPGTFYQDVCMESGERFSWTFAHAARSGGPGYNPQVAVLEIVDPVTGTLIQSLATQQSFIGGGWSLNTGSIDYSGTAGVKRFQFRSTNPGSFGNFLDAISVSLAAYVEMNIDSSGTENIDNIPGIIVSGTVDSTVNVPFTIVGGTATLGEDYTLNANFITVDAGVYPDSVLDLPITIIDDSKFEPDETIIIDIGVPSNSELEIASGQCGPAPKNSLTYTLIDDDPNLTITKSVSIYDPLPADGLEVYAIPGNDVIYTFTLNNSGNGPTADDSLVLIDTLPSDLIFYNGDIDDGLTPQTDAVTLDQTNNTLNYDAGTNVKYSNSAVRPVTFADCNYVPLVGYDVNVKHICIKPDGAFAHGTPTPEAIFKFRAQIQ